MFCANCGKPLSDSDLFCGNCGAKAPDSARFAGINGENSSNNAITSSKRFFTKGKTLTLVISIVLCISVICIYNFHSNRLETVAKNHLENYIVNNYKPILKYCPFDMKKILDNNYDKWLEAHSSQNEEWEAKFGQNLRCEVVITDIEELDGYDYEDALDSFDNMAKTFDYALKVNKDSVSQIVNVKYDFTVTGDKDGFSGNFHEQFYKISGKWYCLELNYSKGGFYR